MAKTSSDRLARALRENLRRRKAAMPGKQAQKAAPNSSEAIENNKENHGAVAPVPAPKA